MLLALETATEHGSVALLEGEQLLLESTLPVGQHHAGSILVEIDRMLSELGQSLDAVTTLGLSIGPGSFTGLRIGLATALGLCFDTERRIVPVPTLAALALHADEDRRAVTLLDARRSQVYAGLYTPQGEALRQDCVSDPRRFIESLSAEGPLCLLGSGATLYAEMARQVLGERAHFADSEASRPRACSVGCLAQRLGGEGAARPPEKIELRYLRRAEAEEKRAAGQREAEPLA